MSGKEITKDDEVNPFAGFSTSEARDGLAVEAAATEVDDVEASESTDETEDTTLDAEATAGEEVTDSQEEVDDVEGDETPEAEDPLADFTDEQEEQPEGTSDPVLAALEEMRAEIRELRQENESLRTGGDENTTDTTQPLEEPNPADFQYGEVDPKYLDARVEYRVQKELADKQATAAAEQETQQQEAANAQLRDQWDDIGNRGIEAYEDFEAVVLAAANENKWALTKTMAEEIPKSPVAVDIAYHLAKNPKTAANIAKKSIIEQGKELGKLEAAIINKKKLASSKVPGAVPPPQGRKPRGNGGKFTTHGATTDFAAFEQHVSAQDS